MTASGDSVFVVWTDYRSRRHGDIYLTRSQNRGTTWPETNVRLDSGPPGRRGFVEPRRRGVGELGLRCLGRRSVPHLARRLLQSIARWRCNLAACGGETQHGALSAQPSRSGRRSRRRVLRSTSFGRTRVRRVRLRRPISTSTVRSTAAPRGSPRTCASTRGRRRGRSGCARVRSRRRVLRSTSPGGIFEIHRATTRTSVARGPRHDLARGRRAAQLDSPHQHDPPLRVAGDGDVRRLGVRRLGGRSERQPEGHLLHHPVRLPRLRHGDAWHGWVRAVARGDRCGNDRQLAVRRPGEWLGGAAGALLLGSGPQSRISLPLLGGTLLVLPAQAIPISLGGGAGAPGQGSWSQLLPIPAIESIIGTNVNLQGVLLDAGAVRGVSMSNALELWIG